LYQPKYKGKYTTILHGVRLIEYEPMWRFACAWFKTSKLRGGYELRCSPY